MDSRPQSKNVDAQIALIKSRMPETYASIKSKAAYGLVKRGLRGEANCFWAVEAGYVMGTPFNIGGIQEAVAVGMVEFGCACVCIFPIDAQEATHGAH